VRIDDWSQLWRRAVVTVTVPFIAVIAGSITAEVVPSLQPRTPVANTWITLLSSDGNPLSARQFYVDPATTAAAAAAQTTPPSRELEVIAQTPQVNWLSESIPIDKIAGYVNRYVTAAEAANKMPLLAIYAIPGRDCGGFTAGGFGTGAQYREWIDQLAAGLGTAPAGIIVEPDALTSMDCLPDAQQEERQQLLHDAVARLTQNPNAAVYIDGGHSRWLSAQELARRLWAVGVDRARGFSLNTSNFFTTSEEIAYGEQVSSLTKGAHYVIDTSRNGAGPAPDGPLNWCNPPGRALGALPTTVTAGPHADAYLWIKHPGESDGSCDRGDPATGIFMVPYAVELVRNAKL